LSFAASDSHHAGRSATLHHQRPGTDAPGDWYDPEVHPKLQSFAAHYGAAFLPTKPYTPRHKGKIERGIGYVKNNALKARFESLAAQNECLWDWEASVADTRIHGTTKRQVASLFDVERLSHLPLPSERFPCFQEARRAVHKDGQPCTLCGRPTVATGTRSL
jgi:hypothetical protein